MEQVREITERYRFGGTVSASRWMRTVPATDRATGEAVIFELVPPAPEDPPSAEERRRAFAAAAGRLAGIVHPDIAPVLDFGVTAEGDLYLVREADDGGTLDAVGGESPASIVRLLLQAVDGLDELARHGLAHGALSTGDLRLVPGPEGPQVRLVGLAQGLALLAVRHGDADELRREDVRSLAIIACRLLGATVKAPTSAAPGVKMPLAVSFELDDAESLRSMLEHCLRRDPDERPASYDEVREALARAAGPTRAAAAVAADEGPTVRLTFSTEPPDAELLAGAEPQPPAGEETGAEPPAPPADEPGEDTSEITKVVMPQGLSGRDPEATSPPDDSDTAVRRLEDTSVPPPPAAVPVAVPATEAAAETAAPAAPAAPAAEPDEATPPPLLGPVDEALEDRPPPTTPATVPAPTAVPTPPPPAAGPAAAPTPPAPAVGVAPPPAPAPAAPAAAPGRRRMLALAAAAAALALAAVVAVALWPRAGETPVASAPEPPAAAEAPALAEPPAPPPLHPQLVAARGLLAQGDDAGAAAALAAIDPGEEAGWTAEECELADLVRRTVAGVGQQLLDRDLSRGLASGDLVALRRAVVAAAADPTFLDRYPEQRGALAQAGRVVGLDDRARAALAGGEPAQALEYAGVLMEVFPRYRGALELRERAAAALEAEAEELVSGGRLEAALDRLSPLARSWPDRPGLAARQDDIRGRLRTRRDQESLLEAARADGARGRPDEGLALLEGVVPAERLRDAFAATRAELARRLAELDAETPQIAVGAGSSSEIVKDEAASLVLRVTDDYKVASVELYARPEEGGAFQPLAFRRNGNEVVAEVPPELHDNRTLQFYAVATDLSGHRASLGGPEAPQELRRRRWYHRFRGD